MKPNDLLLQSLEGKRVHHVACGANMTYCVVSDDTSGSSLGSALLKSIREVSKLL